MNETALYVMGQVFNVQRYSIHDGPGIRTVVFLKGCPLRCRWCCNPESQSHQAERMERAGKWETVGKNVTVAEILDEVKQDRPYYFRSGGGVTLSGGEAFAQPDFARALFKECRSEGINTAVETAGSLPFSCMEPSLSYLDYVLMDIKHMDPRKHLAFTGMTNERMLENAKQFAKRGMNLTIRVPVIPTFNDTVEEIGAIAAFAAALPGVRQLHLLPYHRLGEDKYRSLGREYPMRDVPLLTDEQMQRLLAAATASGLDCRIGG